MENYEKIKILGKGSFGSVHLVQDDKSKEFFALKKVQFELNNTKLNPINEVKLMNSIDNCNIIKCHGYFSKKDKLYIIMEYADDGDLEKLVKEAKKTQTPISEKTILTWFTQICLALKYLHDKNILHRDIKLQNIFLMKNGIVKLGDFGISKKLDSSTALAETSLGTPYYLSPELCSAHPYGRKTDIWMLGCLLYEVCSLEKPFSGENISVLMSKILKEEPKPLPVVYSNFIQKLTRTLLTKNHQKRPEIEEILAFKELRIEIKSLIERFPNYYKPLEELYCKNQDISVPKTFEYKKKSLIKPLSYSNLPNVEITNGENIEKWYTPNNQKKNDDKNSILNVIKQAKKKRPDELDSPQVPYNNSNNIEQDPSDSAGLKGKVSFEQYLTKKLIVEKTEDNMVLVKKNEKIEEGDKKKNLIEKHNKKLKNLDIIEEKSPMNKFNLEEEEEKKSNNNISINNVRIISPTNFNKLKRNSPKGNILEIEIVSSQRSKLFIEFLKERLGEEKFEKVKAILQTEENNSTGNIIDKKRNEILEVIGIKNAEVLKYLGVLCKDGLNKDKKVIMIEGLEGGIQETRIDRTCSGNAKLEGGSSRK